MNRRKLRAEREPDDPLETEVLDVAQVGPKEAAKAFTPFGGRKARILDERYSDVLQAAIETGEWIATRTKYQTHIPIQWREDHYVGGHGTESEHHEQLKIILAEYLDRSGHSMETVENYSYDGTCNQNREWMYGPENFEKNYGPGIADVRCCCDDCTVYGEVGYTAAEKWVKGVTHGVESLFVVPYSGHENHGRDGETVEVYHLFENSRANVDLSGYASKACPECSSRKVAIGEETSRLTLYECEDCYNWWYENGGE